jgi:rhodanese-related sulfurtransferase
MLRKFSRFVVGLLLLSVSLGLSACSTEKIDTSSATAIIDVRTAEEFQAGHLDGAININVEGPNFDQEISALDKAGEYFVYCRSGRRSAIAVTRMSELGFSKLTDLGSLDNAASKSGLAIVVQ